jgi:hypothetical protein
MSSSYNVFYYTVFTVHPEEPKNSIEILNDVGLCQEKEAGLFKKNCPHCYSEKVKIHSHYQTKENGERKMLLCQECKSYFAETHGSVIAG